MKAALLWAFFFSLMLKNDQSVNIICSKNPVQIKVTNNFWKDIVTHSKISYQIRWKRNLKTIRTSSINDFTVQAKQWGIGVLVIASELHKAIEIKFEFIRKARSLNKPLSSLWMVCSPRENSSHLSYKFF